MNVYDFDGTIYDGESTFDFYLYCVFHHPVCIKFAFIVLKSLIRYKMCRIDEKELMSLAERYICEFLSCCPDARELSVKFWDRKIKKIQPFFLENRQEDDIIVSASFGFLLRPLFERLGIKHYLLSEIDFDSVSVIRLCYRKNKVRLFRESYGCIKVCDVYTDSLNDKALMSLAGRDVYLVKHGRVRKYIQE